MNNKAYKQNNKSNLKRQKTVALMLALIDLILILSITFADKFAVPIIPTWNDLYVTAGGLPNPDSSTRFEFMDIGQGDCELLASKNQYMLIDSGTSLSEEDLYKQLKEQGITKIDYLLITHPHADHIGGAAFLVEKMEIGKIIMQDSAPHSEEDLAAYSELTKVANEKGVPIEEPHDNQLIKLGDINITLHLAGETVENENDNSIVVKAEHNGHSVVYMGDAEEPLEQYFIGSNTDLDCDVLKLGHHGSKTSTSEEFLRYTTPSIAIISCGENNQFNHPSDEIVERLNSHKIPFYRTDIDGTITVTFDNSGILVSKEVVE